ncbi:right-handed parallel beta-helix repeat-containing protein [Bacteroidota bacterium]
MKTLKLSLTCLMIVASASFLLAQTGTIITTDSVKGRWTVEDSPFYIQGDITIPSQDSLVIEPGVKIIFEGYYKLDVEGTLLAIGTPTDSIIFTKQDTLGLHSLTDSTGGWHGIRFDNLELELQDEGRSIMKYCQIKYSKAVSTDHLDGGAISIINYSNLLIDHCAIIYCIAQKSGGGLYLMSSGTSPTISNSYIKRNHSGKNGGGISISADASPIIYGNKIVYNQSEDNGGGLYSFQSKPKIINNIIANNLANKGGGLGLNSGRDEIFGNIIVNNTAVTNGGGMILWSFKNDILNNTIAFNEAPTKPGMHFWGVYTSVVGNNIIWKNHGTSVASQIYINTSTSAPKFSHCIIDGGQGGIFIEPGNEFYGSFDHILDVDPNFINENAGTGIGFDWDQAEWQILTNSPAINKGSNELVSAFLDSMDYFGENRVSHGTIDIGASETHITKIIVSGKQPNNTLWVADTVLVINKITIPDDSLLNISEGSRVVFDGYFELVNQGTIIAKGTPSNPIVFTVKDTLGFHNTTNNEGGWKGITMDNSSQNNGADGKMIDNDTSVFEYCVIEYAKDFNTETFRPFGGGFKIKFFSNLVIRNSVIRNNKSYRGGGIGMDESSNPVIMGNQIYNNSALNKAGGIYIFQGSNPQIVGNLISNNRCEGIDQYSIAGGVYISVSDPLFQNNIICNNESLTNTGGILIKESSLQFSNNVVANNKSVGQGGGMNIADCDPGIYNSIIWGNISESLGSDQIWLKLSDVKINNCNIENGTEGIASDTPSNYKIQGLVTSIPGFVTPSPGPGIDYDGTGADWSIDDFSELINAGFTEIPEFSNHLTDYAGNPRINDGIIDIGAYENTSNPLKITRQPLNIIACEGDSIAFVAEADGLAKYQWMKNGEEIQGVDTTVLIIDSVMASDEANYSCVATNGYGEVNTNNVYLQVKQPPEIIIQTESQWIKQDDPMKIEVIPSGSPPLSFQWSKDESIIPGAVSALLNIPRAGHSDEGEYTCVIKNSCASAITDPVIIYTAPQICMVTVSEITGNNLVVWEKKTSAPILAYNIYRESSAAGIYDRLETIPNDNLSVFVDSTADPTMQAYLYKITALDTAGVETDIDLCKPHKTIHLLVTTNPELNTTQLAWDRYYGFEYQTYLILRSANGSVFSQVQDMSSNLNSWTDPNPVEGELIYRIAVEKPLPCIPEGGDKKAGTGPYYHALSNMDDNKLRAGELPPDTITLSENSIEEENQPGRMIGKLFTLDLDTVDSHTYKFVPGNGDDDNVSFSILSDMLLASEEFDYETKNQYSVRIRSTDEAGNYCEIPFIILIINIDETTGLPVLNAGGVRAFPNPFDQSTTIRFPNPSGRSYRMVLMDLSGKVYRIVDDINISEYVLQKGDLKKGLYFIELRGPKIYRGKIVIE